MALKEMVCELKFVKLWKNVWTFSNCLNHVCFQRHLRLCCKAVEIRQKQTAPNFLGRSLEMLCMHLQIGTLTNMWQSLVEFIVSSEVATKNKK